MQMLKYNQLSKNSCWMSDLLRQIPGFWKNPGISTCLYAKYVLTSWLTDKTSPAHTGTSVS